jgi:hypothetical protein
MSIRRKIAYIIYPKLREEDNIRTKIREDAIKFDFKMASEAINYRLDRRIEQLRIGLGDRELTKQDVIDEKKAIRELHLAQRIVREELED